MKRSLVLCMCVLLLLLACGCGQKPAAEEGRYDPPAETAAGETGNTQSEAAAGETGNTQSESAAKDSGTAPAEITIAGEPGGTTAGITGTGETETALTETVDRDSEVSVTADGETGIETPPAGAAYDPAEYPDQGTIGTESSSVETNAADTEPGSIAADSAEANSAESESDSAESDGAATERGNTESNSTEVNATETDPEAQEKIVEEPSEPEYYMIPLEEPNAVYNTISPITINFEALCEDYRDVVGWLYSPDTIINYPLAMGKDNAEYLHKSLVGSYLFAGTIFGDASCRRDFGDTNTIFYGHNMQDGSMFARLLSYRSQEYYNAHPVMYLNTPRQNYRMVIFTAYITPDTSDAYKWLFESRESYQEYLDSVASRSLVKTGVTPDAEYRIVTLSTCTYEYENARFVVQGMLVPIGGAESGGTERQTGIRRS